MSMRVACACICVCGLGLTRHPSQPVLQIYPLELVIRQASVFHERIVRTSEGALQLFGWAAGERFASPEYADTLDARNLSTERALASLRQYGLFYLRLSEEDVKLLTAATSAASHFFASVVPDVKTRLAHDKDQKVFGYQKPYKHRESLLLRKPAEHYKHSLPWSDAALKKYGHLGPTIAATRDACDALYDTLEALGDWLLMGMENMLNLPPRALRDYAPAVPRGHLAAGGDDVSSRFGADGGESMSDSIMMAFRYAAQQSSTAHAPTATAAHAHIDVGLLTLAPLSDTRGLQSLYMDAVTHRWKWCKLTLPVWLLIARQHPWRPPALPRLLGSRLAPLPHALPMRCQRP